MEDNIKIQTMPLKYEENSKTRLMNSRCKNSKSCGNFPGCLNRSDLFRCQNVGLKTQICFNYPV